LFFFVHTEEQAQSMGQLLEFLSTSTRAKKLRRSSSWSPVSETSDPVFEAREEGNKVTITVSRYERVPANRKKCIEYYGPKCSVCGFDFSVTYGKIGKGYIHVHHLTQLSNLGGKAKRFNPITDLRPVCPNCHEMLHRRNPDPYTIDELKNILSAVKTER
jgi:5-methylcytosine-specific restriction enzyme A